MSSGWKRSRIDEIEPITIEEGLRWHPVRRALGIEAFGVNAFTATEPAQLIIERHDESGLGHEELYVVLSGRVAFELDEERIDAPAGTVVSISDPGVLRVAHATDTPATVLAIGAPRGSAYEPSAWEWYVGAERFRPDLDTNGALALLAEAEERYPDHAAITYSRACWLALAGRDDDALAALERAIELAPAYRDRALRDDDLASVRERLPA
jgi:tetratricopeptide (TPR) repeat protein